MSDNDMVQIFNRLARGYICKYAVSYYNPLLYLDDLYLYTNT